MSERLLNIGRFTLEAVAPLSISSGAEDPMTDAPLVRDPNGIPMIPATTIAGALREHVRRDEPDAVKNLFGFQKSDEGAVSRVSLSDALAHWSDNRPRDGLVLDRSLIERDALAQRLALRAPLQRDHIRLNEFGVADNTGKFDRAAVPKGTRFTFELSVPGPPDDFDRLRDIIHGGLTLGGAGRSGYGQLSCVRWEEHKLNLARDRKSYVTIAASDLSEPIGDACHVERTEQCARWRFSLTAEGPVLVGAENVGGKADDETDSAPYSEVEILWSKKEPPGEIGKLEESYVYVIPGSAIKGPLRHRTRFHFRNLCPNQDADEATAALFGEARDNGGGQAGRLRFNDIRLDKKSASTITVSHVSLDRFSGGARRGALFTNIALWRPVLEISIDAEDVENCEALCAFEKALGDLRSGLLGVGADWGEGSGVLLEEEA